MNDNNRLHDISLSAPNAIGIGQHFDRPPGAGGFCSRLFFMPLSEMLPLGVAVVSVVVAVLIAVPWWQCDKFHAQMFDTRRRSGGNLASLLTKRTKMLSAAKGCRQSGNVQFISETCASCNGRATGSETSQIPQFKRLVELVLAFGHLILSRAKWLSLVSE